MSASGGQWISALSMLCSRLWSSPGKAVAQTPALLQWIPVIWMLARLHIFPVRSFVRLQICSILWRAGWEAVFDCSHWNCIQWRNCLSAPLLLVQPGTVGTSCWVTLLPPAPACSGTTDTLFLVLWNWNRPSFPSDPNLSLSHLPPLLSYTSL